MNESDLIRLRHMRDAARKALAFAEGKSRASLDQDEMLVLSLVKCIEIIGEAASKVSESCQRECQNIPWADIVAMRNRLIHAYFDINLNIVWSTGSTGIATVGQRVGRDTPIELDKITLQEEHAHHQQSWIFALRNLAHPVGFDTVRFKFSKRIDAVGNFSSRRRCHDFVEQVGGV